MGTLILQALTLGGAAVTLLRAEPVLNKCGPQTPVVIRASFYLLSVAALWQLAGIITGDVPTVPACLLFDGVAALLLCERRLRLLCPVRRVNGGRHVSH